jgi:hypothetical protein
MPPHIYAIVALILILVLTVTSVSSIEYFAVEQSVVSTLKTIDKDIDDDYTLYRCSEILPKGPVSADMSITDADKFGRCTGIMDFKNRLLQKIKDIVGVDAKKT